MKRPFPKRRFLLALLLLCAFAILNIRSQPQGNTYFRDQVAVLIYHHIDKQAQSGGTITPALFQEQLSRLQRNGFHFITLQEFKRFMEGDSVPPNAVLVTFDDGYESFYTEAYPVLNALSVPAVHFIITKDLDQPPASGTLPSLTSKQILELTGCGDRYEIQSHSDSLHAKKSNKAYLTNRLPTGREEETEAEHHDRVVGDIRKSFEKLKPLESHPVDSFAYPFGIYNRQTLEWMQEAGVRFAFTVQPGIVSRDMDKLQIPRINAGSPWITPELLMETIRSQVKTFREPLRELPIRHVMEQVGGSVQKNADDQIVIYMDKQKWTFLSKTEVVLPDGRTVALAKPLVTKRSKAYIHYADFENLFGSLIVYDPAMKRFYRKTAMTTDG